MGHITPRTPVVTELEVVSLAKEKKTSREIADQLGMNIRTVQRIRSRHGVAEPLTHSNAPVPLATRLEIKKMLNDNASHCEIARTLGVSRRTIERWYPNSAWPNEKAYMFAADVSATVRRARRQGVPL